jgi:hypothetical protein
MSDGRETPKAMTARTGAGSNAASITLNKSHATAPCLTATNQIGASTSTDPMQLGAIKEVLHQFAAARRDIPKEQLSLELRELYRFLCRQAQLSGVDPLRAMELYRAEAAKRRPSAAPRQVQSSVAFARSAQR